MNLGLILCAFGIHNYVCKVYDLANNERMFRNEAECVRCKKVRNILLYRRRKLLRNK